MNIIDCGELAVLSVRGLFMPTYDRSQRMWFCSVCGVPHGKKPEALACEVLHKAWKDWSEAERNNITEAEGESLDLQLAKRLGYPVGTEEEREIALKRITDLTRGGRDHTFQEKIAGAPAPAFGGAKGRLIDMNMMHSSGRVQVPAQVRRELGLQDGHNVFWYELGGRYFISPRELSTTYQRGKMA